MELTVIDHPLAAARLTMLRDRTTGPAAFRLALHELTAVLVYEALRDAPVRSERVDTPVAPTEGYRLARTPLLVPILRAGLGMLPGAHQWLPDAQVGFVGVARDERTLRPRPYLQSLPEDLAGWPVLVLEPMLATGGSMEHTLEVLAERGATEVTAVCALVAPEGLDRLGVLGQDGRGAAVRLVTACVDAGLNEQAFIVPGLGDAGDRQYGAH